MRGKIVELVDSFNKDKTYCKYISNRGINYQLLEGMTIGKGRFTSNMVFIMLEIDCNLDSQTESELFKLCDSWTQLVDFHYMAGDEETYGLEEEYIKDVIDKYEEDHKELIDFIIANNIETY